MGVMIRASSIVVAALMALTAAPASAVVHSLRANLDKSQVVPPTSSPATGTATFTYDDATGLLSWTVNYSGLVGTLTQANLRGPAEPGQNASVQVALAVAPSPITGSTTISAAQGADLLASKWYVNLQTNVYSAGEIRGQVIRDPSLSSSGDFNRDSRPDIIWTNTADGATFIWRMNGITFASDQFVTAIDRIWELVAAGDFNRDGKNDIVWRHRVSGVGYAWHLNDGVFISDALIPNPGTAWRLEAAADFNADGRSDLLFRNQTTGEARIYYITGPPSQSCCQTPIYPFTPAFFFNIAPEWRVIWAVDFNGDRQPDLLFRHATSGLAFVWYTEHAGGTTTLGGSTPPLFSIDPVWEIVQVADWNVDGQPDLLFRNMETGVVFVWYTSAGALAGSDFVIQIDPLWEIVPKR